MARAALFCLLGVVAALVAHVATRVAERRARDIYRDLVGGDAASAEAAAAAPAGVNDEWKDIRPLVASWGCLVTVLEFVRGAGMLLALAALLYLIAGR